MPFQDSGGSAGPSNLRAKLNGFPWLTAGVLYTLSWAWSLLRPNTLYWDDWQYIFDQPSRSLNRTFLETGLPPWRALIDQEMLLLGHFLFPILSFVFFFIAGILYYLLLKKIEFLSSIELKFLTLIFLMASLNHARVAKVMFGYTTSYFLFFLGWTIYVYSRSWRFRLIGLSFLFLSFMTHSLLFFSSLILIQILYLQRMALLQRKFKSAFSLTIPIVLISVTYIVLRSNFWMPKNEYVTYQKIYHLGVARSLVLYLPFTICCLITYPLFCVKKRLPKGLTLLFIGTFALAVSLTPYVISNNINRYVFSYNIGWESRHLLLVPIGLSFIVVGLSQMISKRTQFVAKAALICFVLLNMFVGIQYHLQSLQQSELVEYLKKEQISQLISEIHDETRRFKGRGASFTEYEIFGMLKEAGYLYPTRVGYKFSCNKRGRGVILSIRSDKSIFDAFLNQNTGLIVDLMPCGS